MIAFDPNTGLMYEGLSNHGHGVWPAPFVSVAKFLQAEEDWSHMTTTGELRGAQQVFREDFFDPISRVRRGRFYEWGQGRPQPDQWWVHKHPLIPEEVGQRSHEGRFVKQLISFTPMHVVAKKLLTSPKTLVALGAGDAITVWNIVSVERTGTNEDLVTLRARTNMGFLPDLLLESVPEAARLRVSESLNKVVDGAHRGSGITVVDLCRDALVVMLATHLHLELGAASNINEKDLGPLIVALPEDRKAVKTAAEVVRTLHSRGKSNEQYRLGTRTVSDMDGTLAIEALGFVRRELGWAR